MRSAGASRRTSRADQADQRRAELLDATRRVVLERGLAATRVADIAKEVNVSGGLIHYHFATKDELITAMLRATLEEESARLAELTRGPGGAVERLDRVLRFYIPESRTDQSWILWIDAWTVAVREPAVREIVRELEEAWVGAVRRVIELGVSTGEFRCPDPHGAAERIDAMLDGLIIRYSLHSAPLTRERLLDHARTAAARETGVPRSAFPGG
ncbi:AcrR family transcriptional regulator [Thermocatellispora tengchongensis]|uniref:AcrR family transcriptional regulator n=1 Tax=Thermocatellispora tengchongensis TaxID=1073253 RepID=A0A840NVH2_9ACTN|nr:TetR family transcriptional regulator C-terminal domain-containing protein [Thermocatellispora tengchongensis]MBB5131222.1 AcrR family transcriptional regulator [Thermocatellispora tengchongensis]